MKTISDIFGFKVSPKTYARSVPLENPDPSLLYGVELEIEHCENYGDWSVGGITVTKDDSLRNYGKEFITAPMTYSHLAFVLKTFFNKAKLTEINYSDRTSVHVHANVQDLTCKQVASIFLLYATFEKLLYAFAGGDRDKNIFCVPWSETNITNNLVTAFAEDNINKVKKWQKYTGLNILPIFKQGTIEFRHLPGTCDLQKILLWCRLIGAMFSYARNNEFDFIYKSICELNTTSEYGGFFESVFKKDSQALFLPGFEECLEDGVLNVKYSTFLLNKKETSETKVDEAVALVNGEAWFNLEGAGRNAIGGVQRPRRADDGLTEDERTLIPQYQQSYDRRKRAVREALQPALVHNLWGQNLMQDFPAWVIGHITR